MPALPLLTTRHPVDQHADGAHDVPVPGKFYYPDASGTRNPLPINIRKAVTKCMTKRSPFSIPVNSMSPPMRKARVQRHPAIGVNGGAGNVVRFI